VFSTVAADADKILREQVSSVAERQQLEAAHDYVREGDSFTVNKLDRLARSVGDLLAIVTRLEGARSTPRNLPPTRASRCWWHWPRPYWHGR
jgi:hypothetical protein